MGKAPCGRNWTVGNSRLDKRVWQLDSSWKQSWNSEATIRRNVLGPYASMDVPWFCLDMTPSPLWNHGVPKAWRVPGVSSILSDGLLLIVPRPGGQTQTPIAQPPQMHKQTYIYIYYPIITPIIMLHHVEPPFYLPKVPEHPGTTFSPSSMTSCQAPTRS